MRAILIRLGGVAVLSHPAFALAGEKDVGIGEPYAGALRADPSAMVSFRIKRVDGEKEDAFKFAYTNVPRHCEDGSIDRVTAPPESVPFISKNTFFSRSVNFNEPTSTRQEVEEVKGRILGDGTAQGFVYRSVGYADSHPGDPPDCATNGRLKWVAKRVR